jgi:hypothetical protein
LRICPIKAINSAIDFWAKCETGNSEFFCRLSA